MTGSSYIEARKYALLYQLLFLIIIGIFGLAVFLVSLRTDGSWDPFGGWQLLTLSFLLTAPLLLAYILAPWLWNITSQQNKYLTGILFTFFVWFIPLMIAPLFDGLQSLYELRNSLFPAAMAALMFGPLLGKKIHALKSARIRKA